MSNEDKIYQVFVSSTYEDLKKERQEVIQALLELDCIPAGMELFPAANDDQWTLIKRVIDRCDYYILIVGDRYGSIDVNGLSYTQKEYEYALEQEVPILTFIHETPENLEPEKKENNPAKIKKLAAFKELIQKKTVKYFNSPADLGGKVSRSIIKLQKSNPAIGWIRGDTLTNKESLKEINTLQKQNAEFRERISILENKPEFDINNIADIDEITIVKGTYQTYSSGYGRFITNQWDIDISWKSLFAILSPYLLETLHKDSVKYKLGIDLSKRKGISNPHELSIDEQVFNTITIQFKALGLINVESHKMVKGGIGLFWSLTRKGEELMLQSRVITSKK